MTPDQAQRSRLIGHASRTRYRRAPIAEAVIDIQAILPPDVGLDVLEAFAEEIAPDYPSVQQRFEFKGQFQIGEREVTSDTMQQPIGYACTNGDGKQVAQAKLDGFSFSRLAPYETFEPFSEEALRLWALFRVVASPQRITRVAVRYINRLAIPGDFISLEEYLRTYPEISPDLPQIVTNYFMQLAVPLPEYEADLRMTQTIVDTPETPLLVLDNDVAMVVDEACGDDTNQWLGASLARLRDAKNAVFEASITDRFREMIS